VNTNSDKVFRARRVITPTGEVAAPVVVRDGRITEITPYHARHTAGEIVDVPDDSALLPGLAGQPRPRQRARPHRVGGLRDRRHAGPLTHGH
jgi:hypothetical protein